MAKDYKNQKGTKRYYMSTWNYIYVFKKRPLPRSIPTAIYEADGSLMRGPYKQWREITAYCNPLFRKISEAEALARIM